MLSLTLLFPELPNFMPHPYLQPNSLQRPNFDKRISASNERGTYARVSAEDYTWARPSNGSPLPVKT